MATKDKKNEHAEEESTKEISELENTEENRTEVAPTDGGQTIKMEVLEKDEGSTIEVDDILEDDGSTINVADLKPDEKTIEVEEIQDDGSTINVDDLDDGSTINVDDLDEGSTINVVEITEGSTIEIEEIQDDGSTINVTDIEAADDGGTIEMAELLSEEKGEEGQTFTLDDEELIDDGGTIEVANLQEEQDGSTIAMPEEDRGDNGQTLAMPGTAPPPPSEVIPSPPQNEKVPHRISMEQFQSGYILHDRYKLEKILGKGGFGAAYLAEDLKLKRTCVVKQMLIPRGKSQKQIEIYRLNFEREASLLVQLNTPGHPSIPEIYDYFTDVSGNYLMMKYIQGQSLEDILQNEEHIPWREAVRYGVAVADALSYMHSFEGEPIMHRDVKPANILLGDDGRVWLVDFGLAKAIEMKGEADFTVTQAAGSVGFAPFEQWEGKAEPASDVYALGSTVHYLVSGKNPLDLFEGKVTFQKLKDFHGHFQPLTKIDKNLSKELEGVIKDAVAIEPEQRPTALQFKKQLEALISHTDGSLFTFKSGETAQNRNELVDLCEKYRSEAQEYLFKGDFERWFKIINRNDLAAAATEAVARSKDRADGLERFLKLLIPNLFLRRLKKAAWHTTRITFLTLLITVIVFLIFIIGSSFVARWIIQQSISGYPWNYSALNLDKENHFSQRYLTEKFEDAAGAYFDDIEVEVRAPNQMNVSGELAGIPLEVPVTVAVEAQKPHFQLSEINGYPLFLIGQNITGGINQGVDRAFQKGPIDLTSLEMKNGIAIFEIEESGRAPFPPPPSPTPTPIASPTPVKLTMVAIFNDLDQDIILEIDGERLEIAAHDSKVIEKEPDTYVYTVRYQGTGQIATQGTKIWDLKVYRWHIRAEGP